MTDLDSDPMILSTTMLRLARRCAITQGMDNTVQYLERCTGHGSGHLLHLHLTGLGLDCRDYLPLLFELGHDKRIPEGLYLAPTVPGFEESWIRSSTPLSLEEQGDLIYEACTTKQDQYAQIGKALDGIALYGFSFGADLLADCLVRHTAAGTDRPIASVHLVDPLVSTSSCRFSHHIAEASSFADFSATLIDALPLADMPGAAITDTATYISRIAYKNWDQIKLTARQMIQGWKQRLEALIHLIAQKDEVDWTLIFTEPEDESAFRSELERQHLDLHHCSIRPGIPGGHFAQITPQGVCCNKWRH